MRSAIAVIGANYGDEGKGLVVDALCDDPDTVVVRFNGGAQAGHTVVTPDGKRHVFHHHGAGTLRGCATYLSKYFILNPLLFVREHEALGSPRVMASRQARVTTPYDMMLNQWAEEDRGHARHGSCGLGINETIIRCQREEWRTIGHDMRGPLFKNALHAIADDYAIDRAQKLGIKMTPDRVQLLDSKAVISQYMAACEMMFEAVIWKESYEVEGPVIFEGAQGLLLDQDAPGFPHLTHSKTGLTNVRELCKQMGIGELDAMFVTRSYMTRHGAGSFVTEDETMKFHDATNISNPWQHGLRFGTLHVPELMTRIFEELVAADGFPVYASVVMTCADQMDNPDLRSLCAFPLYVSHGPSRLTFGKASKTLGIEPSHQF